MYFNFNFDFCFLFLFLFSNANRAIEQRITNWQAGKSKFSAVILHKQLHAGLYVSYCILYEYVDTTTAVQVPPHSHCAYSLFQSLTQTYRHGLPVVATQLHMFLVCRSARSPYIYLSMDSYQALVACYTHSHVSSI